MGPRVTAMTTVVLVHGMEVLSLGINVYMVENNASNWLLWGVIIFGFIVMNGQINHAKKEAESAMGYAEDAYYQTRQLESTVSDLESRVSELEY